ncbi:hypothetical protein ACNKHM_11710 [Shigella sonnei]
MTDRGRFTGHQYGYGPQQAGVGRKLVPGSPLRRCACLSPLYVHWRSWQRRTVMVKPLAVVAVGGNALVQTATRYVLPMNMLQ